MCDADAHVCDQCWHLAGGAAAVEARLAAGEPALVMDPLAETVAVGVRTEDVLHRVDRMLVERGVLWATLRQVAPPARVDLALRVQDRVPPAWTRPSTDPQAWLELVTTRVHGDEVEFRQEAKRRRWLDIYNIYAVVSDTGRRRPLTRCAHEVVAETLGCSTKTVQRALRWAERQGLLWEVLPGTRLPKAHTAEVDPVAERRRAAAAALERARRAVVDAELEALRDGATGTEAMVAGWAAEAALLDETASDTTTGTDAVDGQEGELINLTPVYELRMPLEGAELAEARAIAAACAPPPPSAGQAFAEPYRQDWIAPANARLHTELVLVAHDGTHALLHRRTPEAEVAFHIGVRAVASGNALVLIRASRFVHPPMVTNPGEMSSTFPWLVDNPKGRAARGLDQKESGESEAYAAVRGLWDTAEQAAGVPEPRRAADHPDAPVISAEATWLLERLDERLADDIDPVVLDRLLRAARTRLDTHGDPDHPWTPAELLDQVHGRPEYPRLPEHIRSARGWISHQLGRAVADPTMPPSKRRLVHRVVRDIEGTSRWFADRPEARRTRCPGDTVRQVQAARVNAAAAARRAAIEACQLCDEYGWLDLPDSPAQAVRCSHDTDTAGW